MQYTQEDYTKALKLLFNAETDKYGNNTMVTCPFHEDKTPSLSIHNFTGQYRCFSAKCKRQGHISSLCYELTKKPLHALIGKKEGDDFISFASATPLHRERVLTPKTVVPARSIEEIEKDIHIDIRGHMAPWYESSKVVEYLRSRHISSEVADLHNMTYMESGFVNGYPYENRLCIPIYGLNNKLLAVEGRDLTGKAKRKCVYPYNSVKPVYGFDLLDLTKPVKLFEGLTKKACAQSDPFFRSNSTNVFGSQISKYQKQYLNLIPELVVCPDNDEAGEQMVEDIKKFYTGKLSVMRISVRGVVDHDQIPIKLGVSVQEFREHGGFDLEH